MAAIAKIRKYYWVLVVMMALAMVGWFIMDSRMGSAAGGPTGTTVGKVNGHSIDWRDFERAQSVLYKNSNSDYLGQRAYVWKYFVEKAIIEDKAREVGLGVPHKELDILQFGQNGKYYSDIIKQRMANPQTRRVDQAQLDKIKQLLISGQLRDDYKQFWAFQQKEIIKSRLQNKYAALVGKAAYTPKWMAEMLAQDQNKKADAAYVKIPFAAIPDDQVQLTLDDYKHYIEENKATYWRDEPTVQLGYIKLNINPTGQDSAAIRQELTDLKDDFAKTTNDSLFVVRYGGTWDDAYAAEEQQPRSIAKDLATLPIGTVVGPYRRSGSFAITKIIDRKLIPDSVRARHILIKADDQQSFARAVKTIDSLRQVIESGKAGFADLAAKYGQDATKLKGGDLGYTAPGRMVKPFNDLIFFKAEPHKLYTVATQFGYHLVEVTGRKFINNKTGIKTATISKQIRPSEKTQQRIESKARQIASNSNSLEDLKAAADKDPELEYYESSLLKENDYYVDNLGSNQTSRKIIRWAFQKSTRPGTVNKEIFTFTGPQGYVSHVAVVGLKAKLKPGLPDADVIKDKIKPLVLNLKKGEMIAAKIKSKDLNAIAAQFNVQVDTARNIAFASGFVPGIGKEPKVVAAIFNTPLNEVSDPVVGSGGVFVVQPLNLVKPNFKPNLELVRQQETGSFASQAKFRIMDDLKKKARIKDKRSDFY